MELTTAQKNELATRLIEAQQTNNYDSFNDLVAQLRLTQADFLENFPVLNQAYITEQIGRGAVVPIADEPDIAPFVEEVPTPITYESPTVEQQAQSAGLLESEPMTPQNLTEFVFSQMTPAELNAYSMLRESGVNEMLPLTTINGKNYFQNSDGSIVEIERTGEIGAIQTMFSPEGQIVERANLPNYGARNPITDAAIAATGGLLLGPALGAYGLGLSQPVANALAASLPQYASTGNLENALKAAALAGLGSYGAQQVTGLLNNAAYDLSFAAADAAQLANQGMSAGAIAQNLATYVDPATAISLANTAATQAFALADAAQLTQQGLNLNQVAQVLESSGINANTAATIAQAAADGVTTLSASDIIPKVQFQRQTNLNQGLLSPADAERVLVTGQAFDVPGIQQLAQGVGAAAFPVVSAVTPGLLNQPADIRNQQVQVEAQTGGTQQSATTALPAAAGGLLTTTAAPASIESQRVETTGKREVPVEDRPIPVMTMAPTIPVKATESVLVEEKRKVIPTAEALIPAGAAGAATGVTAPATPTNRFGATDAALVAFLLSGAGSLLNQGGGAGFTMDPNLANSIINAPRPVSPPGMGGYQMPGMFQIAPTNVYNPFATTAPFGAGRFGGFAAPITLPFGLLATDTNPVGMRLTTPTRGLA